MRAVAEASSGFVSTFTGFFSGSGFFSFGPVGSMIGDWFCGGWEIGCAGGVIVCWLMVSVGDCRGAGNLGEC